MKSAATVERKGAGITEALSSLVAPRAAPPDQRPDDGQGGSHVHELERPHHDLPEAVVLINLFDVDPEDAEDFKLAWAEDAAFFKAQPGYVSAQLHQGLLESHKFLNYAVFENAAAFAATTEQPEFGPLRRVYPDSAVAHPHLFRRLHIPRICVGEVA